MDHQVSDAFSASPAIARRQRFRSFGVPFVKLQRGSKRLAMATDKEIEAAAQAMYLNMPERQARVAIGHLPYKWWEQVHPSKRRVYLDDARIALEAAANVAQDA